MIRVAMGEKDQIEGCRGSRAHERGHGIARLGETTVDQHGLSDGRGDKDCVAMPDVHEIDPQLARRR